MLCLIDTLQVVLAVLLGELLVRQEPQQTCCAAYRVAGAWQVCFQAWVAVLVLVATPAAWQR